ncbi:MAG: protein kinase [Anaerolineales bacterium]|jgi:serine/threonine-protein kinase
MATSLVGQIIRGQYRVDAFIASGGMAVVYRVWDLKRNVSLAMKVLHLELADDPTVFKLFKREARALKKLAHPNIVSFYGLQQTGEFFFLLEEYIDGSTLKAVLRKLGKRPMATQEVLIYLKAISSALGYAHAHGVVHCDVKPGNVMIDQGGVVYLSDFGIARHSESTVTTIGMAGTLQYMAPEQFLEQAVTPATDVYALGVMLYQMLTGAPPFRAGEGGTERGGGTSAERMRQAHLHETPQDPRKVNAKLPEALAQVLMKALAKDPADRFPGVRDVYLAACQAAGMNPDQVPDRVSLRPEAGRKPKHAVPLGAEVPKPVGAVPAIPKAKRPIPVVPAGAVAAPQPKPKKRALPWILGGVGVVAVGIIVVGLLVVVLSDGGGLGAPRGQDGGVIWNTAAAQTLAAIRAGQDSQGQPTIPPPPPGSSPTEASTPTREPWVPWHACSGAPWSRVTVGIHVMVSYFPPSANRVRRHPNLSGEILGLIEPGDWAMVLDGPECADNMVWWKVETSWGLVGWTAEGDADDYWLVPPD